MTSAIDPEIYGPRFCKFMADEVIIEMNTLKRTSVVLDFQIDNIL